MFPPFVRTGCPASVVALAVAGLTCAFAAEVRGAEAPSARGPITGLYDKVRGACFELLVDDHLAGSGWWADPTGLGFTAAHAIPDPGRRVEILSSSVGRLSAAVVGIDRGFDLALLRVEGRPGGYAVLPFARRATGAGEEIYHFGGALYRHELLQRGMVARNATTFEYYPDQADYVEIIHVSATMQGGTSGGPWLNRRGEVVGLQSGVMSINNVTIGVAYLSPLTALQRLLKERKPAATPTLGLAVEETWQQDRGYLERLPPRTEGLVVRVLKDDGPAARAGVKVGDIVVAADGAAMRLPDELLRAVRRKPPGAVVSLRMFHPEDRSTADLPVTLDLLESGWK